jgi:hypothetical protein
MKMMTEITRRATMMKHTEEDEGRAGDGGGDWDYDHKGDVDMTNRTNFPKIVCLRGSTYFYEDFVEQNFRETMAGKIVLSVGFFAHRPEAMRPLSKIDWGNREYGESIRITAEQKIMLDELHMRKIDLCDEVLVINVGGYIGDSTRREIAYATSKNKLIRYLEKSEGTAGGEEILTEGDLTHCERELISFMSYCKDHPKERFWQALRNWSGWDYVLVNKGMSLGELGLDVHDTYYWISTRRPGADHNPVERPLNPSRLEEGDGGYIDTGFADAGPDQDGGGW